MEGCHWWRHCCLRVAARAWELAACTCRLTTFVLQNMLITMHALPDQDAEAEQAARGEASELHVIIFDEIDAICKQRGSVQSGSGCA